VLYLLKQAHGDLVGVTGFCKRMPDRQLHLAVPRRIYEGILTEALGQLLIRRLQLRFLVFDEQQAKVLQWIS
jgi:hypothetical protein